jgi:cyclopropane fatty-acyl-phospholipid synthase-like methyltransferase
MGGSDATPAIACRFVDKAPGVRTAMSHQTSLAHRTAPGDNLLASYLRLFREFRRTDLDQFCDEHHRLMEQARRTQDFTEATRHYYGLMAPVIAAYYGEGWHFCPPEFPGQSRRDATHRLYRLVAEQIGLGDGKQGLDVGCGVGGMLRFVAKQTGAAMTGVTLGENEVEEANAAIADDGLAQRCRVLQGDNRAMPLDDESFDAAYAVYALKYHPKLDEVFREVHRVLKPNGRFAAYCLCKSESYRDDDPVHARTLSDFEYSTAMPRLHTVDGIIESASRAGLRCTGNVDISTGALTWYSWWVRNPFLPWLVSSRITYGLARFGEALRMLPRGFARFNDTFLAGTVRNIIRGGRMGILTGSVLLTFEKSDR